MICTKCKHRLPDDSEFCQYCGERIEKEEVQQPETIEQLEEEAISSEELEEDVISSEELTEASEPELPDLPKATPEEALKTIIEFQAKQTIKHLEENR